MKAVGNMTTGRAWLPLPRRVRSVMRRRAPNRCPNIARSVAISRRRSSKHRPLHLAVKWIAAKRPPRTWGGEVSRKCVRPPSSAGRAPNAMNAVAASRTTTGVQDAGMTTTAAERSLAGSENVLPEGFNGCDVGLDFLARHRCLGVGRKAPGVLQAPVFAIGIAGRRSLFRVDQPQFSCDAQQGNVAEVASQAGVLMGVAEHQVLNDELDINDAADVVLQAELGVALGGVRIEHLPPHGDDLVLQLRQSAWLAQDFGADFLEALADGRITGTEAGAGQGLMFPDPGVVQLIVAESIDRYGEQAGVAVGA